MLDIIRVACQASCLLDQSLLPLTPHKSKKMLTKHFKIYLKRWRMISHVCGIQLSYMLNTSSTVGKNFLEGPFLCVFKTTSSMIKGLLNGFPCRIAWSMHAGCCESFGKRKNTRAAGECIFTLTESRAHGQKLRTFEPAVNLLAVSCKHPL